MTDTADIEVTGLPRRLHSNADRMEARARWERELNRYFANFEDDKATKLQWSIVSDEDARELERWAKLRVTSRDIQRLQNAGNGLAIGQNNAYRMAEIVELLGCPEERALGIVLAWARDTLVKDAQMEPRSEESRIQLVRLLKGLEVGEAEKFLGELDAAQQ